MIKRWSFVVFAVGKHSENSVVNGIGLKGINVTFFSRKTGRRSIIHS